MKERPFFMMVCFYLLGILFRMTNQWYFIVILFGTMVAMVYPCIRTRKWKSVMGRGIFLLSLFLFGMLQTNRQMQFRQEYQSNIVDNEQIVIQGEIYKKEIKKEQYLYYLKNCYTVFSKESKRTNNVIAYLETDDYSIGQILVIQANIKCFAEARNEGNFDAKEYYWSQKIDYAIDSCVVQNVYGKENGWREKLFHMRCQIEKLLSGYLSKEDAGILSVMLLGDKGSVDPQVKSLYQDAGIAHILAISGLHVSLVGMGIYRWLRKRRISFCGCTMFSTFFLYLYYVMTGMGISTLRAVGMLLISMIGRTIGRSSDLINSAGFMLLLMLVPNPFLLYNAAFLLSFGAVFGVAITGNTLCMEIVKEEWKRKNWRQRWKESCCISIGIQLTTLPIIAYFFYEVPTYSLILNLLVLALLPYILKFAIFAVAAGELFLFAGKTSSFIAKILFYPCKGILRVYEWMCRNILHFPCSRMILGMPSYWKIIFYYLILGMGLYFLGVNKRKVQDQFLEKRERRKRRIFYVFWILILFECLSWKSKQGMELDILDVGQGDGIYLRTDAGTQVFFDGGSTDVTHVGTYRIEPFLKSKGVAEISYWFVSHTDSDHISGLIELLDGGYPIANIVISNEIPQDEMYQKLIQSAEQNETDIIRMRAGEEIHVGNACFQCVFPTEEYAGSNAWDKNNISLVIRYEEDGWSGLFGGDLGERSETYLLYCENLEPVNYMKALHHGADTSNTARLLNELKPEIITVSCGRENSYGHPGKQCMERMQKENAEIYLTMEEGQIRIDRDGVVWTWMEKKRQKE